MKSREQIRDELLVLKSQAGEAQAFNELVGRWQKRLWRHAYSLTGEQDAAWDAVQEAWVAIVKGIPRLQDAAAFPKWAYRILTDRCADWVRRQQRDRRLSDRIAKDTADKSPGEGEAHDSLRAALERLSGEQRALLSLRYSEGYDTAEIAAILGVPEGTVKSRLYHAREQVRRLMEGNSDGRV